MITTVPPVARSMTSHLWILLALVSPIQGCAPTTGTPTPLPLTGGEPIRVTLLHINDVYEITPLDQGRSGGLSRIATLRHRLLADNPNTLLTLGGDFFSPSAVGTALVDGARLAGRQMVATLNATGVNLAVFGNHEFDLREPEFLSRLGESRFPYLATNVTDANGDLFPGTVPHRIVTITAPDRRTVRIGFVGATIRSNSRDWVRYTDPDSALRHEVTLIRDSADAIVALTHLPIATDLHLAETVPELTVILGGHEHDNQAYRRGPHFTPVLKADANARSAVIVHLTLSPGAPAHVSYELVVVTDSIPEDPVVRAEANQWMTLGTAGMRASGFEPDRVVTRTTVPLDGREAVMRTRPTLLGAIVASALRHETNADVGLFNTGSIRIDDVLPPGPITEYDLIRLLPFGGHVVEVEMTGSLLSRVLATGESNRGTGGYLAWDNVGRDSSGQWSVGGAPLDTTHTYRVVTTDYLVSGAERNLGYLAPGHPGLRLLRELRDIRQVVMTELRRRYGLP